MFKFIIFSVACSVLSTHIWAMPVNDDRIVFQDDDISEFRNRIFSGDNKNNFRRDFNEKIQKELENGEFFQGDIILHGDQMDLVMSHKNFTENEDNIPTRTGLINEQYRWPKNNLGQAVIPYVIDPSSGYSSYHEDVIHHAMYVISYYTCMRFVERTTEPDFLRIFSGEGCYSHMGKIGGEQKLSLKKRGCMGEGTVMHELIHAIGYDHMHSHAGRDKFVKIEYKNIKQDALSNFDKVDPRLFSNFGTEYDLISVMHYDTKAFSKNGKETIVPKDSRFARAIGQREGLSEGDIQRINNMYECPSNSFQFPQFPFYG